MEGLGWLPTLGKLACLAWLALALTVSWSAKGAPDEAIFLLAPRLLLLNRSGTMAMLMILLLPLCLYCDMFVRAGVTLVVLFPLTSMYTTPPGEEPWDHRMLKVLVCISVSTLTSVCSLV